MISGGFAGGVGMRLIGVAAFAVFALVAVLVVERGGNPPAIIPTAPVASTISGRLVLETTYPVTRWTVQVQGKDVVATQITAQRFEADVSGDGATIFVQAEQVDPSSSAPAALRWSLAGKSGVLWGEGAVAGTLGAERSSAPERGR
ncbi:MAG: hypothetical protein H0W78_05545 [Planctomycetes bacterium]|nr:hypothetical protein [Planctomycetota bacterium]